MAVGNSGDVIISQTSFYGGMGTDKKIGIKNSYADSESIDARKNPSVMTVLPGSHKLVDDDIDSLIVSMDQSLDGIRWGIGTDGTLYKIDDSNDVTVAATMPSWGDDCNSDLIYYQPTDTIYITGNGKIYSYGKLSGTPTVQTITSSYSLSSWLRQILIRDRNNKWVGGGVDRWAFKTGGAGTYSVTTGINEADAHKCLLLSDESPVIAIGLIFRALPASGTVTITIHNSLDEVVASQTVNKTAITIGTEYKFTFSPFELRSYPQEGIEYHIHLSASVSGFTVDTYESATMYGLHFNLYAALLRQTLAGKYPIARAVNGNIVIGNGRDMAEWLPSGLSTLPYGEFTRSKIFVYYGGEITSFSQNDEYTVIGIETVGELGTRTFQSGMIAFWDGYADSSNFSIETPMGPPKSLFTYQNITYTIIDGAIYAYTGGKALTKIRTIQDSQSEYTEINDMTDIYSHCMTVRRGILLMAYPSITNLKTMRYGIYSYGSVDKDYPNSFYYSYQIPEDDIGNYNTDDYTLTIGGVWNYGDVLYFSYRVYDNITSDSTFNLALVNNDSLPARSFKYESLMFDGGMPWKDKEVLRMVASFDPLPDGCKIKLKYKINNNAWVVDNREAVAGDIDLYVEINKRFREIQFGLEGTYDNDSETRTPARITSVGINVRELGEEGKMHRNG